MSEQYYANAKEAQAKWAESMKSVYDEARRAFDGETLRVDSAAAGERIQQGIDQTFDFWSKAVEFNRDVFKRVAEANLEYLNVLQRQAEAAGGRALEQFEEARVRSEQVAERTQEAMARSASQLEEAGRTVADRTAQQFEKNVDTAAEQTVKASRQVADQTEKAADQAAEAGDEAREEARETGARTRAAASRTTNKTDKA
ncbi:hypothetical protein AADG42_02905 [Ammonicoccus fulvus]|uniref:Phasin family protein n=1 Tax=Ammonicoccus fulvus TaxID=3138240 RepID=A0ABZ3FN96_9ACTN